MSGQEEVAISVQGVSKAFRLPHERHGSIKNVLFSTLKGKKRTFEKQRVLNDISFEIKKGEFFGIVGRNGSGKSTLLKLLAGIYSPNKGHIQINGKLTPFIELGVGFNPELTGRENVFLNGALLGFSRPEMEKMYDEIVDFAELEKFMDQKLKNYSSGMQVRLAFSIAIRANTDILLLDEVLAVGDTNFQQKCFNYFKQLKKLNKTVIFVSHDMNAVRNYCTKALLLSKGSIIDINKPSVVVNEYDKLNIQHLEEIEKQASKADIARRWGTGEAEIASINTYKKGKKSAWFSPKDEIEISIDITTDVALDSPVIGMTITDSQGLCVFATNTLEKSIKTGTIKKGGKINCRVLLPPTLTDGEYRIACAIANSDRTMSYARVEDGHKFSVVGWTMPHSMFHPDYKMSVTTEQNV